MSRLKNFSRGMISAYVSMGANVVFSIFTVPLALHYLSKEDFAIWAIVTQVAGYLTLLEIGMGVSASRVLANFKDDRDGGHYGSVLKCCQVVFSLQGALIGALGWFLAAPLADAFAIVSTQRDDFVFLIRMEGLVLAVVFFTKMFGTPFWSHQRYDVTNYSGALSFVVNVAALWIGFERGWGVRSLLAGQIAAYTLLIVYTIVASWKLGFLPRAGHWGKIDRTILRDLLVFGRDIFIMALGTQLLSASQVLIVSRTLGLEAAATWAICSKLFALAQQAVSRVFEISAGALTEMFVRGEHERLRRRFRDLIMLTAALSIAIGAIAAAANEGFVEMWTKGRIAWPPLTDFLLGLGLCVYSVVRCHTGMAGITMKIASMRFVYLLEGVTFVLLAVPAAQWWGMPGVALASVIATAGWSGAAGLLFIRNSLQCGLREQLHWLSPAFRFAALFVPIVFLLRLLSAGLPGIQGLLVVVGGSLLAALPLLLKSGFPSEMQSELQGAVRRLINVGRRAAT